MEIFEPLGIFVVDVRALLDLCNIVSLSHVGRNANRVAHCIAEFALSNPSPSSWIECVFSYWVASVSNNDL